MNHRCKFIGNAFVLFFLLVSVNSFAVRIVSLSPNITEMLFAIGAGKQIVAVDSASDKPTQVLHLPKVASVQQVNLEKIIALKPDVVIAWPMVLQQQQLQQLKPFGIKVYYQQPQTLHDIAVDLVQLGKWTGHQKQAQRVAVDFVKQLQQLRHQYQSNPVKTVFYQLWQKPLLTVNATSSVGQILQLCHVRNIFSNLHNMSSAVNLEAVIAKQPQIIIVKHKQARAFWLHWLPNSAIIVNEQPALERYSPAILGAAQQLCQQLSKAK